jgi:hypothetical protein
MSDVERWLAEKENEKGGDGGEGTSKVNESSSLEGTLNEMRDHGDARPYRRAGTLNGQVRDLTRFAIHHVIACFSPSRVHRASDQFIVRDPRTDELLNNRPLRSITKYTTGLCLPHFFLRLPPPKRISQPTIYPSLRHPSGTTTIMSAVPNGRLHISVRLGSSRPMRALTTPITLNNEPLWIGDARQWSALSTRIRCRPSCALPGTSSVCSCWSAAGADGIHVGNPSATACKRKVIECYCSPTPRKRYAVALGEPIKPRVSASPPPISVGDDDDGTITITTMVPTTRKKRISSAVRSTAQWDGTFLRSIQRVKGANCIGLGFGFGFGMGNGTGEDTDTSVDSALGTSATPQRTPKNC